MRAHVLAVIAGTLIAVTSSMASDLDVATVQWQQQEIDLAMAPIKSRAHLAHHLQATPDSPIKLLPAPARQAFLDSLVFTQRGLASYSWRSIAGNLNLEDAYRLLALFGLQSDAARIPGVQPATEVGQHMVDVAPMIQNEGSNNQVCALYAAISWCQPHPGSSCSVKTCR